MRPTGCSPPILSWTAPPTRRFGKCWGGATRDRWSCFASANQMLVVLSAAKDLHVRVLRCAQDHFSRLGCGNPPPDALQLRVRLRQLVLQPRHLVVLALVGRGRRRG